MRPAKGVKMYSIVRFMQGSASLVVKEGLTLEEAQAICQRSDTKGQGWFYGYRKEE